MTQTTDQLDLFANLNPAQKQAVAAVQGPVLVLAGPGSGKTRVLINRVGYLIQNHGIAPWQIMAVTFTNKAAKEMRERLSKQGLLTEAQLNALTVGTFHAICARILRQDIEHLDNYNRDFVIFDTSDQKAIVKRLLKELNLDPKRYTPQAVLAAISNAKNELLTLNKYIPGNYWQEIVRRVYESYQNVLELNNALDFDDILLKTHQLFSTHKAVLDKYQQRYIHILVDEFQDTNMVQYDLVKFLAGKHQNLFVVGDEDQSIYSWRGADYRNVNRFKKEYRAAQTILLEQNYRSTQTILEAASRIIAKNQHRHSKNLFTNRNKGADIIQVEAYNETVEAQFIVNQIQRMADFESINPSDVAVMYRTNAQSRVIEEAFIRANMPYRLVRGTRFYQRKEVKDAMAYLRLIHNPHDSVSLARIINVPARQIGPKTVNQLFQWAQELNYSPWQALVELHNLNTTQAIPPAKQATPFAARATKSLVKFSKILMLLIAAKDKMSLTELIDLTLARTGYKDYLLDGTEEGEMRWENLQEIKTVARQYNSLAGPQALAEFLEEVALVSDVDGLKDDEGGPALLTLHAAKGLEFPIVFMAGMEDGIFPHSRSHDNIEEMAEERRLAYVGVTRAKDRLYLSHAFRRTIYGRDEVATPSIFLADIPSHLVDMQTIKGGQMRTRYQSKATRTSRANRLAHQNSNYQQQTQWKPSSPSKPTAPPKKTKSQYKTGDQVKHTTFGTGTVISVKMLDNDEELTVAFPNKGIKRLLTNFAKLEKL